MLATVACCTYKKILTPNRNLVADITDGLPNNPLLKCNLCAQRLEDTHFVQVSVTLTSVGTLSLTRLHISVPDCGSPQVLLPLLRGFDKEARNQ